MPPYEQIILHPDGGNWAFLLADLTSSTFTSSSALSTGASEVLGPTARANGQGYSQSDKISLGIGIGIGVPSLIGTIVGGVAAVFAIRRRQRLKNRRRR